MSNNLSHTDASYSIPPSASTAISGTYNPTLVNTSNIDSSTPFQLTYLRVGNTVFVSGQVEITAQFGGLLTVLNMDLPIPSNFSTIYQAGGTAIAIRASGAVSATIVANDISDDIELKYYAPDAATRVFSFSFGYEVAV